MNWISVKDKLPEKETEVLIYIAALNYVKGSKERFCKRMEIGQLSPVGGWDEEKGEAIYEWDIWDYVSSEFEVLFWMPLPESPKVE
jgi:hypothetical protein